MYDKTPSIDNRAALMMPGENRPAPNVPIIHNAQLDKITYDGREEWEAHTFWEDYTIGDKSDKKLKGAWGFVKLFFTLCSIITI